MNVTSILEILQNSAAPHNPHIEKPYHRVISRNGLRRKSISNFSRCSSLEKQSGSVHGGIMWNGFNWPGMGPVIVTYGHTNGILVCHVDVYKYDDLLGC